MTRLILLSLLLTFTAPQAAFAQPAPPSYGHDFITIGDTGNPDADPSVYPIPDFGPASGGVDYEYRIAKSKVRVDQWVEFVTAYWGYRTIGAPELIGGTIGVTNFEAGPGEDPGVFLFRGELDWATSGSWRAAARYANWLHNDKVNELWAFETGAYDFTQDSFPIRGDDARYWVPTLDEWNKAVYWDPDRFGEGQGGYWTQPNSSDDVLVAGMPGVGETPALDFPSGTSLGQYPGVQTPWGLEDVSGHLYEIVGMPGVSRQVGIYDMGSESNLLYSADDRLGSFAFHGNDGFRSTGIRLASSIPTPGVLLIISSYVAVFRIRRNR